MGVIFNLTLEEKLKLAKMMVKIFLKLNNNEKTMLLEIINNLSVQFGDLLVQFGMSSRTGSRVCVLLVEKGYWKTIK